jgi:hypothetical protein
MGIFVSRPPAGSPPGESGAGAMWAARKRRAPATISYPSLLGRTVMGWMSPWVRRLSAFCSADHFVADEEGSRMETGGSPS